MDGTEYLGRRTRALALSGLAHALAQAENDVERARIRALWAPALARLHIDPSTPPVSLS